MSLRYAASGLASQRADGKRSPAWGITPGELLHQDYQLQDSSLLARHVYIASNRILHDSNFGLLSDLPTV